MIAGRAVAGLDVRPPARNTRDNHSSRLRRHEHVTLEGDVLLPVPWKPNVTEAPGWIVPS